MLDLVVQRMPFLPTKAPYIPGLEKIATHTHPVQREFPFSPARMLLLCVLQFPSKPSQNCFQPGLFWTIDTKFLSILYLTMATESIPVRTSWHPYSDSNTTAVSFSLFWQLTKLFWWKCLLSWGSNVQENFSKRFKSLYL